MELTAKVVVVDETSRHPLFERVYVVEPDEGSVTEAVAKLAASDDVPCGTIVEASAPGWGDACWVVSRRGTFTAADGSERPSKTINLESWGFEGLAPGDYPEAFLTCINPADNAYKFYHLVPEASCIKARYGRIGDRHDSWVRDPYPPQAYWAKYFEKLSKGYVDQTDTMLDPEVFDTDGTGAEGKEAKKASSSTPSSELYDMLLAFAHGYVEQHLQSSKVTAKQAKRARELLDKLAASETVQEFNDCLLELMSISPRNVAQRRGGRGGLEDLMAGDDGDFAGIYDREESLVLSMEAVAGIEPPEKAVEVCDDDPFEKVGLHVQTASQAERSEAVKLLGSDLGNRVKSVYKVDCDWQRKRFESYCESKKISDTRLYWHGSRNCNWLSIMKAGLLLNPDAQITGKMFGNGIYFAPSARKSWGYTSARGSYWANGRDDTAIMGLYRVAYGKPLECTSAHSYTAAEVSSKGCDCVHAKAGQSLLNDEVIFYDEAASVLEFLVVLG